MQILHYFIFRTWIIHKFWCPLRVLKIIFQRYNPRAVFTTHGDATGFCIPLFIHKDGWIGPENHSLFFLLDHLLLLFKTQFRQHLPWKNLFWYSSISQEEWDAPSSVFLLPHVSSPHGIRTVNLCIVCFLLGCSPSHGECHAGYCVSLPSLNLHHFGGPVCIDWGVMGIPTPRGKGVAILDRMLTTFQRLWH